jgi:hypothetical protein
MFTVNLNKQLITVDFHYLSEPPSKHNITFTPSNENRMTSYAIIYNGKAKDKDVAAIGKAICHPIDMFNKKTGRKLALMRALKNYTSDKNLRKLFWATYFESVGGIK